MAPITIAHVLTMPFVVQEDIKVERFVADQNHIILLDIDIHTAPIITKGLLIISTDHIYKGHF